MNLKTLKDLKHFSLDEIKRKDFIGVALQSRTKKASEKGYTCKIDINPLFIHANLLKAEAIKWAKKYNFLETHPFCWFHNITEEDLK